MSPFAQEMRATGTSGSRMMDGTRATAEHGYGVGGLGGYPQGCSQMPPSMVQPMPHAGAITEIGACELGGY